MTPNDNKYLGVEETATFELCIGNEYEPHFFANVETWPGAAGQDDLEQVLASRVLYLTAPDGTDFALSDRAENGQAIRCKATFAQVPTGTFNALLVANFADEMTHRAKTAHAQTCPEYSASVAFVTWQRLAGFAALAAVATGLVLWPAQAIIAAMAATTVTMLVAALFKSALMMRCIAKPMDPLTALADVSDDTLPTFTLMFPLFREAQMVARLLSVVEALDYPRDKLQVQFVIEEEDTELRTLFSSLDLPWYVSCLVVPASEPQTKPKALNFALMMCDTDIVSVFDAEDRIDPDHLRRVAELFATGGENLACVQTMLELHTDLHNWLTKQFTLEYGVWYNLVLPSIGALGLPVPLGGTGNHFKRNILCEVGAWDCYNVTEDADLGMRLHLFGYKVQVAPLKVIEDPNRNVKSWVNQRSRWIKGHMQTYLVYMRNPFQTLKRFGVKSFAAFQMLFGVTFIVSLLSPVIWSIFVIWLITQTDQFDFAFPTAVLMLGTFNLLVMNAFFVLTGLLVGSMSGRQPIAVAAFTSILYGLLASFAAFKALWQLIFNPHYWEKTEHADVTVKAVGDA